MCNWSPMALVGGAVCALILASGAAARGADQAATVYTLSVVLAGTGSGTVTSSPAGIDCGSACAYGYPSGAGGTLSATGAPESTFAGWWGAGCSGTGTCQVTMSAAESVTATFEGECVVPEITGMALK